MSQMIKNNVVPNLTLQRNVEQNHSFQAKSGGLSNTFSALLKEVNEQQLEAERKQTEFLTSPNKDVHGTMIAMEKADISLKMLLQVRGKLVSAYEEVMRMQV